MRVAAWARNFVLGLTVTLGIGAVYAQTPPTGGTINVVPINSRYGYTTPSGVATATSVRVSMRAAQMPLQQATRYFSLPITFSFARLGQMARGVIRGTPASIVGSLAAYGIIQGLGWAINELTGEVMTKPADEPGDLGPYAFCILTRGGEERCMPERGQLVHQAEIHYAHDPWSAPCKFVDELGGGYQCYVAAEDAYGWVIFEFRKIKPPEGWPPGSNANTPQPQPVTDEALGKALAASPRAVNELLNDPQGKPYNTPELAAAINALSNRLGQQTGLTPVPFAPPSDDPEATPEPVPEDTEGSDWPEFCDYATKVCEFIDWFRDDEGDDVPLPEMPVAVPSENWSSGWGNGSCPAPEQVDIQVVGSGGTVAFDWQPVCDFAVLMRPFLIAVSMIVSALILAGLRGGVTK